MKFYPVLSIVLLGFNAFAANAWADLPAPGSISVGDGYQLSGLLDSYYEYNFNNPTNTADPVTTPQNRFRAFDTAHNQFMIHAAEMGIHHAASPVGFDFVLGAGTQLTALNGTGAAFSNVRTASIHYMTGAWTFTAGHFDAHFGLEQIDAPANWDYSRSLEFSLLEPMTYTGLKAAYACESGMGIVFGVVNGVNRFTDNNRGKTFFGQLTWGKGPVNGGLSYTAGPESTNDSTHWTHTAGAFVKGSLSESADVGLDATFVHNSKATVDIAGDTTTTSNEAVTAYGMLSLFANAKDTLRLGWLNDPNGAATLSNASASLYELTLTHKQAITQNLAGWLEVRYDLTSGPSLFYDNRATVTTPDKASQVTATLAATLEI